MADRCAGLTASLKKAFVDSVSAAMSSGARPPQEMATN